MFPRIFRQCTDQAAFFSVASSTNVRALETTKCFSASLIMPVFAPSAAGRFECRSIKEYVERQGICWGCCFENKIKIAAETLYQLAPFLRRSATGRKSIPPTSAIRGFRHGLKRRCAGLDLAFATTHKPKSFYSNTDDTRR